MRGSGIRFEDSAAREVSAGEVCQLFHKSEDLAGRMEQSSSLEFQSIVTYLMMRNTDALPGQSHAG